VQDEEVKVADAPKKMKKKSRKSLEKWLRRRDAATRVQRVFRRFVLERQTRRKQIDHEPHSHDEVYVDEAWELEQDVDCYRWEQREFHD
jgi:hypothetical protein